MTTHTIRRGQIIQPYGVGALVEAEGESFIIKDISSWSMSKLESVYLNRLRQVVPGISELKQPRDKDSNIPVTRFPKWLFCPSCRVMYYWKYDRELANQGRVPRCNRQTCSRKQLVPMRFIRVCDAGHIDDIDWYFMVHKGVQTRETGQCNKDTATMKFLTGGARGGDFDAMKIVCDCNPREANTNFRFIQQRVLPGKCSGRHPWQRFDDAVECNEETKAEPRGSSSLHYPSSISALDFPDSSTGSDRDIYDNLLRDGGLNPFIETLRQCAGPEELGSNLVDIIKRLTNTYADDHDYERDYVYNLFIKYTFSHQTEANRNEQRQVDQGEILNTEYEKLVSDADVTLTNYTIRNDLLKDDGPCSLGHYFRKISRVERLKEVRIFKGFCRRDPSNESQPADFSGNRMWLPASEVIGEGIFLEFNPRTMCAWESNNGEQLEEWIKVQVKIALAKNYMDRLQLHPSPRFVMMHTLAHLLIRELAFECGYSSNSIRERIYIASSGTSPGGILLYTADSDSEGSMGGLVELGYVNRFWPIFTSAVRNALWCSSDPVCREAKEQGLFGLNKAACHACALVGETSCVHGNSFLDRLLVSGSSDNEIPGYFQELIDC
ncbi:hypothetical protein J2T55_000183 [Methylohalomonas lacus]|uniref:MrfA-like Zn-binding domain-containing protein n=1 Tax=Methylohalomonas lacus TaxID=398773 RepID=A0AAE3HJE2_9GAMM|nr:DUF1998 domain-containing protein [Methylohalomonas lacus]MCS3902191.1 hypothetical protein [Methylohalomonas lacus]